MSTPKPAPKPAAKPKPAAAPKPAAKPKPAAAPNPAAKPKPAAKAKPAAKPKPPPVAATPTTTRLDSTCGPTAIQNQNNPFRPDGSDDSSQFSEPFTECIGCGKLLYDDCKSHVCVDYQPGGYPHQPALFAAPQIGSSETKTAWLAADRPPSPHVASLEHSASERIHAEAAAATGQTAGQVVGGNFVRQETAKQIILTVNAFSGQHAEPPPPLDPVTADGRLASDIRPETYEWLVPDMIARGVLSFAVGAPGSGKSTYGAWLISRARRPAILPGFEESVSHALVTRLKANDVDMASCLILDKRDWCLPRDYPALLARLSKHKCDLLWIDPVESHISCMESDTVQVRSALEAYTKIAQNLNCAVVATRHPGKSAGNYSPGVRPWRAVPRSILVFAVDDGPPENRILWQAKCQLPTVWKPHTYEIIKAGNSSAFILRGLVPPPPEETDKIALWKVEQGVQLLRAILADGEMLSSECYKFADGEKIDPRTLRMSMTRLQISVRREGKGISHRSYWYLAGSPQHPDSCSTTPATPEE